MHLHIFQATELSGEKKNEKVVDCQTIPPLEFVPSDPSIPAIKQEPSEDIIPQETAEKKTRKRASKTAANPTPRKKRASSKKNELSDESLDKKIKELQTKERCDF